LVAELAKSLERQKWVTGVSELIVLVFTDRYRAPEVLNELIRQDSRWSEDLERAVAITLNAEAKASVYMNVDLSKTGVSEWAKIWGALLKSTLFVPLVNGMVEAADNLGCPSVQIHCSPDVEGDECREIKWWRESLKPSENFPRDLAALISRNSSAVLLLARKVKISEALEHFEKYATTIVHTTISPKQDEKLSAMLKQR
jgi:uncharacterized membrane protein